LNETNAQRGVDIAGWLDQGWRLFWKSPAVYALSTAIIGVSLLIFAKIPLLFLLVSRPLALGLYLVVADQDADRPFQPSRLFGGFAWLFSCLVAAALIAIFTAVGLVFLIIPGLIISSMYIFTGLFIVDRDFGFWSAMESSRRLALNDVMGFLLFYMALILINVFGALCFGVGLFITIPLSATTVYSAYKELAGLKELGAAQNEKI